MKLVIGDEFWEFDTDLHYSPPSLTQPNCMLCIRPGDSFHVQGKHLGHNGSKLQLKLRQGQRTAANLDAVVARSGLEISVQSPSTLAPGNYQLVVVVSGQASIDDVQLRVKAPASKAHASSALPRIEARAVRPDRVAERINRQRKQEEQKAREQWVQREEERARNPPKPTKVNTQQHVRPTQHLTLMVMAACTQLW